MVLKAYKSGPVYQGRLEKGVDIVSGLTAIMQQNNIAAGMVSGIGAVSEAQLGYFNAQTKTYEKRSFQENMEIVSLKGNISIKDNGIFPHLHVVLSSRDFSAVGGHLFSGTVYAFEFEVIPFENTPFVRAFDNDTGLFLWKE
jgi:predicted DNA-binding protein with PD1-like motif